MRRLHTILFLMLLSAADGLAHSWIYNNLVGSSQHRSNSSAPMDNLAYTYDGNRISSVNGQTYGHDANGNVTIDSSHGTQASYNLLNLPRRVEDLQSGDGLNYAYLADGTKAAMTDDDGTGYAYAGDMVFARSLQGTYSFESVAYGNGRIEGASNTVRRYVTDHLGNVRAIVTGNSVVERNDYYPFGGRHPRNTLPVLSANRWRLGAKESQPSLTGSLVDFGARMYDPHTGRWTTQDPMAWKYMSLSPYNYCGNNPVNLVDPDGKDDYWFSDDRVSIRINSDPYDRILFVTTKQSMIVKDKRILQNFKTYVKEEFGYNVRYAIFPSIGASSKELLSVFKFVSNNSPYEWVIHNMDNGLSIFGSKYNRNTSGSLSDYLSLVSKVFLSGEPSEVSKIHSHPDVVPNENEELDSMGYPSCGLLGDWENYKRNGIKSEVYFPNSKHTYLMDAHKPILVR